MNIQKIREKVTGITKIPSNPQVISDIIRLVRNSQSSIRDFERVIQRDPSITAQVLRVANSPYFGLPKSITNLRLAITLLGLDEISRICLNIGLYKKLKDTFANISFDFNLFWQHSEKTAKFAELLAQDTLPQKTAEAYVLGLLHDIGKLILDQYFKDEWSKVQRERRLTREDMTLVEEQLLGFNHGWLAAELLNYWNFPDEIVEPIVHHHDPLKSKNFEIITAILYVADKYAAWRTPTDVVMQVSQENLERDEIWKSVLLKYPKLGSLLKDEIKDEIESGLMNWIV